MKYDISLLEEKIRKNSNFLNELDYRDYRFYNAFKKEKDIVSFFLNVSYWQQRGMIWNPIRKDESMINFLENLQQPLINKLGKEAFEHSFVFQDASTIKYSGKDNLEIFKLGKYFSDHLSFYSCVKFLDVNSFSTTNEIQEFINTARNYFKDDFKDLILIDFYEIKLLINFSLKDLNILLDKVYSRFDENNFNVFSEEYIFFIKNFVYAPDDSRFLNKKDLSKEEKIDLIIKWNFADKIFNSNNLSLIESNTEFFKSLSNFRINLNVFSTNSETINYITSNFPTFELKFIYPTLNKENVTLENYQKIVNLPNISFEFIKEFLFLLAYFNNNLSYLENNKELFTEINFYNRKFKKSIFSLMKSWNLPIKYSSIKLNREGALILYKFNKTTFIPTFKNFIIKKTVKSGKNELLRKYLFLFKNDDIFPLYEKKIKDYYYNFYSPKVAELLLTSERKMIDPKITSWLYKDLSKLIEMKVIDFKLEMLYYSPYITGEESYLTGRPRYVLPFIKPIKNTKGYAIPVFRIDGLYYNNQNVQEIENSDNCSDKCGTFFYFEPESVMFLVFQTYRIYKNRAHAYQELYNKELFSKNDSIEFDVPICCKAQEQNIDILIILSAETDYPIGINTEIIDTRKRQVCYSNLYQINDKNYLQNVISKNKDFSSNYKIFKGEYGFLEL